MKKFHKQESDGLRLSEEFDNDSELGPAYMAAVPSSGPSSNRNAGFDMYTSASRIDEKTSKRNGDHVSPYLKQISAMPSNNMIGDDENQFWKDEVHPRSDLYDRDYPPLQVGRYLQADEASANQELRRRLGSIRDMGKTVSTRLLHITSDVGDGEASYESAYRMVQAALEAENSDDLKKAMELYTEAGNALIKVGKTESDQKIQISLREKAFELLRRAEYLMKVLRGDLTDQSPVLPPDARNQFVEVPIVEQSWGSRLPPFTDLEFKHMRYTAVTSKAPISFTDDGYVLRTVQLGRHIHCLITVTMYNEDADEMKRTLLGIARNLKYLYGRKNANAGTLEYLNSLGAFDLEIMTVTSLGLDVSCHLFETTLQILESEEKNFNSSKYYPPLQFMYALKERNAGKLDSHLWFFNAFAEQLRPKYTILVDVGTVPSDKSIFLLLRSMDRNPQIAGVCGEIAVDFRPRDLASFVISSQHFEYKISNCMDKALESIFGFISVLPGAFSGYRYEAIRPKDGQGPLVEYFKSLTTATKDLGAFKANMYLAEDRILCFELISRRGCRWTMHYVKDAVARTDVPDDLIKLIKQRRRWLNGSFFAGLYAIFNFGKIWSRSSHSMLRRFVVSFQFFYLAMQVLLNWFLVGNLFLTFYYVLQLALNGHTIILSLIFLFYGAVILAQVILGLGNKPEKEVALVYNVMSIFMGLLMYAVTVISILGLSGILRIGSLTNETLKADCSNVPVEFIIFGAISSLGLIFLSAAIHGELLQILATTLQYFWMLPTYVNILGIYSYCNLHDLSWGTKGLEGSGGHSGVPGSVGKSNVKDFAKQQEAAEAAKKKAAQEAAETESKFRYFRSFILCSWLFTNAALVYMMTEFVSSSCFLKYLTIIVAFFNIVRFLGSTLFIIFRMARRLCICWKYDVTSSSDPDTEAAWAKHRQERSGTTSLHTRR